MKLTLLITSLLALLTISVIAATAAVELGDVDSSALIARAAAQCRKGWTPCKEKKSEFGVLYALESASRRSVGDWLIPRRLFLSFPPHPACGKVVRSGRSAAAPHPFVSATTAV